MSLKKWAYLAEIGSAIVVVLSLIYVGYELNQNTNAVRANNLQALIDYAGAADNILLDNADVARIVVKAESNYDDLTEEEKRRFGTFANNIFNQWNAAYQYHQQGVLEAEALEAFNRSGKDFLEDEAYRGYWERNREFWIRDFAAYIDGVIEQGGNR